MTPHCFAVGTAVVLGLMLPAVSHAAGLGEQLNPTGDPIGGGPGYRDIKTAAEANVVVSTREELINALQKARSGMLVYVRDDAEIDMTGAVDIAIPGGVSLAGGRGRNGSRGALIYSNSFTENNKYQGLFATGGEDVRITGLRIRGPFGEVGDHHYQVVMVANGVRANHENVEIDNCELWSWNKWAIDLAVAGGAHVHHNYIHHTRRWGYGYGIWVRGGGMAVLEANLFDYCRHHIGSGAQATSSYEARFNICLYHDVQPSFDRHGNKKKAGFTTHIHHNEFRNPSYAAILLRGNPLGKAHFHHNWFAHANRKAAIVDRATQRDRVHIHDNHYAVGFRDGRPEAEALAVPAEGVAPLTVRFDGSGSRDREGGRIVRYRWNFGDTSGPVGAEAWTPTPTYTFKRPGRYLVALYAANERGIPGVAWIPVTVRPPQGGHVLSAWVKDSYDGPLKGYLQKQILIDGHVIWQEDLQGAEGGWQHLVLDVSRWIDGKEKVELAFRLVAEKDIANPAEEIVESYYYIDDVHLFRARVLAGDFEETGGWQYRQQPRGEGGFRINVNHYWTGEARSGRYGYVLGAGYRCKLKAGAFCEVRQTVSVGASGPAPRR